MTSSSLPPLSAEVLTELAMRFGLSNTSTETQQAAVEALGPDVMEAFIRVISTGFTESQRIQAASFVEAQDPKGLLQYLTSEVPDFYERFDTLLPKQKSS